MSQDIVEQLRNAASEAECPIVSLAIAANGAAKAIRSGEWREYK